MAGKESFTVERNYLSGTFEVKDVIHCNILGMKKLNWVYPFPIPSYNVGQNDVEWVEISGSEYSIEELDLVKWMKKYGELLKITIRGTTK